MCLMHPMNCEYLCDYGLKITISTSPAIIRTQWWNRLILWLCWKFPLDVLIFFHITFYPTMMKSTHLFPCDRWCLFHVSERKMQPGDSGLVTPCWITGKAPPVLLWTTPKSRATAYHLRRNRPAQYTLGETHANVEKKWSPQHSCAPCVALSVASSGWRQWTPSLLRRADVPSQNAHSHAWKCLFFQISSRRYINQPALKHVLPSHNEFNTLLSAILMIQSRDFPIAT